eukprot:jgi/Tetstr1/444803/TSEL_032651.t1
MFRAPATRPSSRALCRASTQGNPALGWRVAERAQRLATAAAGALMAGALALGDPGSAQAIDRIGGFAASGLVFKDSVEVLAINDPDVEGVVIYISDFKRSITDKLAKDFFAEPSQASISCGKYLPAVSIKNLDAVRGSEGREVFAQQKNLNLFQNKTLRVRRIYDEPRQTMIYVAYSTRLTSASSGQEISAGRYRTSLCAVPLVGNGEGIEGVDAAPVLEP